MPTADQVIQLYRLLQSQPVSIDILPPGFSPTPDNPHAPFEFVQHNLGIPKRAYYGVYLAAVDRLNGHLGGLASSLDDATSTELLSVTAVVLLVNPAHASALNIRKHMIESSVISEKEELGITGALQLTSDGAKSSILWHHRRWLLRRLYSSSSEETSFDTLEGCKLPMDVVLAEFAAVATAGEIYPRNYHAWRHRHICLRGAVSSCRAHSEQQTALAQLLRAEEFGLKKWTELHVTDYTSMQYLCQLYAAMDECGVQHIHVHEGVGDESDGQEEEGKVDFSLLGHFKELVTRYPSHEALWYALRSAYALLPDTKREMGSMKGLEDNHLQKFERWRVCFDSG